ncbi:MAG: HTH domain-containing protein [Opitutales bacterium]|nr:HTH domain-containing protein [Opitutales bacterium]
MPVYGPTAPVRLHHIHTALEDGQACSSRSLAEELGVSDRTVRRDIQRMLLAWGEHATVLGPPELREAFTTIAQHFSKKYLPPPSGGHSLSGVP